MAVDNSTVDKPVLTLDKALRATHSAHLFDLDGDLLDMRGEVGLLTRNVKL